MQRLTVILASILAALLLVGAFVGGYFAGKGRRPQPSVVVQTDTIVFRDTVTKIQPEYITKETVRKELVYLKDTVRVHDSVYVVMEVEKRVYEDSNYRAVVSGIRPSLDEISVYPKTQVITTTVTQTIEVPVKTPKPWGVGVQAGFGGQYGISSKRVDYGPYIGVGISYNIIRW